METGAKFPSQSTVLVFIKAIRALGYIADQTNKDGFVIAFAPNDEPSGNDEAEFFGTPADFLDFVIAKLSERVYNEAPKSLEAAMQLHGIKLFVLRKWTPEAAEAYYRLAGVAFSSNSLVPIGVNAIFEKLIGIQRKLTEGLERPISAEELHRQYVLSQAAEI